MNFNPNIHICRTSTVIDIIKHRTNKKSQGEDGISNFILRKLSLKFITILTTIFVHAYNIAYFPTSWKVAIIVPIPKKNQNSNLVSSYRPISMISCLGKIFESCIKNKVLSECENNNTLPDDQFGFRSERSTIHPLVKLQTDIVTNINAATPTIACAIDIEKAFDTVWIDGLLFKLIFIFKFNLHLCLMLKSYLYGRKYYVKINDKTSSTYIANAGVPQGGVLSALLYIIYISDMPRCPPNLKRLQYADDMIVYISSKHLCRAQETINSYLIRLNQYFKKWKIRINIAKTEAIVFKGHNRQHSRAINRNHNNIKILVNNQPLILQNSIKYLGVTFTKKPSHISHITNVIRKAENAYSTIRPILKRTNKLSIKVKLLCYKQLIRPIITYAYPAWAHISSHQMERLRRLERKCIRACINHDTRQENKNFINNSTLYTRAGIKRIDCFMLELAIKTFTKWPDFDSTRSCIYQNEDIPDDPRLHKPPWYIFLLYINNTLFTNASPNIYHERFRPADRHLGPVYNRRT